MSAFYAFAAILLLLVTVVVVSAVRERSGEPDEEAGAEARLEAALEALRQLEFDRETEKLPEEEYRRLREMYARRAVRARDELDGAGPRAVAATREAAGEPGPRAGRPEGEGGTGTACPECGEPWRGDARFCSRCGAERRPA